MEVEGENDLVNFWGVFSGMDLVLCKWIWYFVKDQVCWLVPAFLQFCIHIEILK